jgi:glutamate decarboxylase
MLAGLALKWRWRQRRRDAGLAEDQPNLVMGANVQVCWEKFCRYWDVEARLVPVGPTATHLTPDGAVAHCDENTIGVVSVLGSTYDGSYEPVAAIAASLDELANTTGIDVPLHVDGASGAMIAPFLDPDLEWDFCLARVQSINTSGHKYGLVYPGVGWIVWRDEAALPQELIFNVGYLGGQMPTFSLNFSRPGSQIAAQYYNFLRLGFDGFRQVQQASRDNARWLADQIAGIATFRLLSTGDGIPAFAFTSTQPEGVNVYELSERLRARGWIVPAYALPANLQDSSVLRVVVRNGFSRDLATIFLEDLKRASHQLQHGQRTDTNRDHPGFHH